MLGLVAGCGRGPDSQTTSPARFGLRGRWEDPSALTYRLDLLRSPLEEPVVRRAFEGACQAWSQTGPVGFRPAREDEAADLVVSWERAVHGPCPPFGMDTSVAHTGPVSSGTFIHLDRDRNWVVGEPTASGTNPSLEQTLLHELGHVLGLDHSPDPGALMSSDPETVGIEPSDRAGLLTLYGVALQGTAEPGPNDLAIARAGRTLAILREVAVPGLTDFELFDTDGDGRDEVVLWRTDPAGAGELVSFFFDSRCRPVHTLGPRPGMTAPEASITLLLTETGERLLLLTYPNGHRIARVFDPDGVLHAFGGELPAFSPLARRLEGDLDGDGTRELIARP